MSLLTIVQDTCDRLNLRRPTAVVSSTDQQVRQLFALANEEGEALSKRANWPDLVLERTFVTTATEVQAGALPSDLREFIPETFFNRTQGRRVIGPVSPQQYQAFKARPVFGLIYLAYRKRGGDFLITPDPPAGDTIAFEYVSTNWAMSSADQPKAAFTSDDDGTYLSEELFKLGLRWRYKQANGLDYSEDFRSYEMAVEQAIGGNGNAGVLSQGQGPTDPVMIRPNVPDGGFGL